jgi:multidrug transporter EmrE-like cation transporter
MHKAIEKIKGKEGNRGMGFTIFLAIVSILLLVGGQTALKAGLNEIGGVSLFGGSPVASFMGIFRTPWVILGFFFYGVSSIIWLDVLSKLDFSLAFPMVSSTYVVQQLIGYFFFHEHINSLRIIGIVLIIGGLAFLIRSA